LTTSVHFSNQYVAPNVIIALICGQQVHEHILCLVSRNECSQAEHWAYTSS